MYLLIVQIFLFCLLTILVYLIIEEHSYAEVFEILNNELLKVSDLLMANKLTIHLEKSHYDIP